MSELYWGLAADFATILLGVGLRRWLLPNDDFWAGMEKLIYYVLFPALLFNALVRNQIDFVATAPLVGAGALAIGTGMLLGLLAFRLFALSPLELASRFQCAFRFNSYIGIAIAGKAYGEIGIATMGVLVGVMIPFVNVVSVGMLARHGRQRLWVELAKNPLVIATLAGLLWNLVGLPVPEIGRQLLSRLSEATVATALLTVGAALRWQEKGHYFVSDTYYVAAKLVFVPLTAWWVGRWLGLGPMYHGVLMMFASLPTATSAYILTARMGGDGPGVARLISESTLAAMITMSISISLIT